VNELSSWAQRPTILSEVICDFCQSLCINSGIVSSNRPGILASSQFMFHNHLSTLHDLICVAG
jgi:hypothetical protein